MPSATFASNGTFSWTCPAYVQTVSVECWGAGGSTPNQSGVYGGSGGGGYCIKSGIYVVPGSTYPIYVGDPSNGSAFSAACIAYNGFNSNGSPGASGGNAVGGDTNVSGGNGGAGTTSGGLIACGGGGGCAGSDGNAGTIYMSVPYPGSGGAGAHRGASGTSGGSFNGSTYVGPFNAGSPGGGTGGSPLPSMPRTGGQGQVIITWSLATCFVSVT